MKTSIESFIGTLLIPFSIYNLLIDHHFMIYLIGLILCFYGIEKNTNMNEQVKSITSELEIDNSGNSYFLMLFKYKLFIYLPLILIGLIHYKYYDISDNIGIAILWTVYFVLNYISNMFIYTWESGNEEFEDSSENDKNT